MALRMDMAISLLPRSAQEELKYLIGAGKSSMLVDSVMPLNAELIRRQERIMALDHVNERLKLELHAASRFYDIRNWAADRNLIEGSDPKSQMLKLAEEFGELAGALARGKEAEADDAIGDMVVVLTILSAQRGVSIENCIEGAWQEIKDRKGKMVDGVFVKEGE